MEKIRSILYKTLFVLSIMLLTLDLVCWIFYFVSYLPDHSDDNSKKLVIAIFLFLITLLPALSIVYVKVRKKKSPIEKQDNLNNLPPIPYTGNMDIKISGKMEYLDYHDLYYEVTFKRGGFVVLMFLLCIVLMLFSLILKSSLVVTLVVIPLVVLLIAFLLYFLVELNIKQYYKSNDSFKYETFFHITDESLEIINNKSKSIFSWDRYYMIKETKNFILLYQDRIIFNYFDKRQFKPEDLKQFGSFLNTLNIKKELMK